MSGAVKARPALVPVTISTSGAPRVSKVVLQTYDSAAFYLLQPDPDGTLAVSVRSGIYSMRVQRGGEWADAPNVVDLRAQINPKVSRSPIPLHLNIGPDDAPWFAKPVQQRLRKGPIA